MNSPFQPQPSMMEQAMNWLQQLGQMGLQDAQTSHTLADTSRTNQEMSLAGQMAPGNLQLQQANIQDLMQKAALAQAQASHENQMFPIQQDKEQAQAAMYRGHVLSWLAPMMAQMQVLKNPMAGGVLKSYLDQYMPGASAGAIPSSPQISPELAKIFSQIQLNQPHK